MYISNNVMGAILRHYKEKEFGITSCRLNSKGTAIYKLNFDSDEKDYDKEIYIQYDHEDKEFYSRVVEIK